MTGESGQVLRGDVAFIEFGGRVYRVLGYATQAGWTTHGAVIGRAVGSFRELTDRAALAVKPWRIEIVRLDRAMSVADFVKRYPTPLSVERVALLNGVEPGATLEAGRLVKRVVGENLPT